MRGDYMGEITPESPPSSTGLRVAVAVLAVALAGAGAYIVHLRGQLAVRAAVPPPRRVAAAPAAAGARAAMAPTPSEDAIAAVLTPAQQQAMVGALQADSTAERKAWFQIHQSNPDTAAVLAALQRVFEQAGWPTETVRAPYALKSGIFLLAGDEQPALFVDTVNDAFTAAGIEVQYLTGYRSFYTDRKQQNPSWVGPELKGEQAFTIVIGSKPTPKAAADGGSSEAP